MLAQSVLHMNIAYIARPSKDNEHGYVQYVVGVSDERSPGLQWTVYRRYSEFRVFRTQLEEAAKRNEMCTHCSILVKRTSFLQFPHRRLFGNNRDAVVESRRLGLNGFLEAVGKHARTCRESTKCRTRPLMDQFLNAHDMRYTFLNVGLDNSDNGPETNRSSFQTKVSQNVKTGEPLSAPCVWKFDNQLEELSIEPKSLPSIQQTRHSFNDETFSGSILHWTTAKNQTAHVGRFSDPGMSASDILSFSLAATTRRPRRLHISSAAKRIKKLEEHEPFHTPSHSKEKQRTKPLATIDEDLDDLTDFE